MTALCILLSVLHLMSALGEVYTSDELWEISPVTTQYA